MERRLELSHLSHAFLKDREGLVPEMGKRQLLGGVTFQGEIYRSP